jgi:hypothetical protein
MVAVPEPASITSQTLRRLRARGVGTVFSPRDLLDLGSRAAVDVTLHRLAVAGKVRRLARGLYDYPKQHPLLGALSPSAHDIARAIAASTGESLALSPASAANALGLSTQVPARPVYLTSGASRDVRVGGQTIRFRHAAPSRLAGGDTKPGLVLRALRALGRDGVTDRDIAHLRAVLTAGDMLRLRALRAGATTWMLPIIDRLTGTGAHAGNAAAAG